MLLPDQKRQSICCTTFYWRTQPNNLHLFVRLYSIELSTIHLLSGWNSVGNTSPDDAKRRSKRWNLRIDWHVRINVIAILCRSISKTPSYGFRVNRAEKRWNLNKEKFNGIFNGWMHDSDTLIFGYTAIHHTSLDLPQFWSTWHYYCYHCQSPMLGVWVYWEYLDGNNLCTEP